MKKAFKQLKEYYLNLFKGDHLDNILAIQLSFVALLASYLIVRGLIAVIF